MADLVATHTLRTAADAAAAYEHALQDENELYLDPGEYPLVEMLNDLTPKGDEDIGGVMAGAAWYVGAAFCPGVRDVQGMEPFTEASSYTTIAQRIVRDPSLALDMLESNDAATQVAMRWLTTRTDLPEVLRKWHRRAARQPGQSTSPTSMTSSQRKARRKAATTSRRKNRR